MYKLTKGIKKKVKGKKKPTEEELEQEELRQYRLEKQREQELREQEQREKEEQELLTLTPEEEHAAPVELVPQRPEDPPEEIDPFDTSIADKFGTVEATRNLLASVTGHLEAASDSLFGQLSNVKTPRQSPTHMLSRSPSPPLDGLDEHVEHHDVAFSAAFGQTVEELSDHEDAPDHAHAPTDSAAHEIDLWDSAPAAPVTKTKDQILSLFNAPATRKPEQEVDLLSSSFHDEAAHPTGDLLADGPPIPPAKDGADMLEQPVLTAAPASVPAVPEPTIWDTPEPPKVATEEGDKDGTTQAAPEEVKETEDEAADSAEGLQPPAPPPHQSSPSEEVPLRPLELQLDAPPDAKVVVDAPEEDGRAHTAAAFMDEFSTPVVPVSQITPPSPLSGFEDPAFDSFLSMTAPPPVPQSTPARGASKQHSEDEPTDLNVFIRPQQSWTSQAPVPALAPPPKPAVAAFQDAPADTLGSNPFAVPATDLSLDLPQAKVERPEPESGSPPETPLFDEDTSQPLEPFPRTTWDKAEFDMYLRQPNKKKITGQRFWKKVFVRLADNAVLQLFNDRNDSDPFQELPLQACYSVSDVGAQQYDQYGKIFTVKLQYIFYKERPGVRPGQMTKAERITKKLGQFAISAWEGDYDRVKEFASDVRKLGMPVEHAPQISQLLKLGTQHYEDVKRFASFVEETLFKVNVHRDRALNYKTEEIQISGVDEVYLEQDVTGAVTKQLARVRLFFLAFLSGMPDVELGINDLRRQGKEVVGRHDIIPVATEEWIRLEDVQFHNIIDLQAFKESQILKFKPPDGCYIELMRFRVRPPRSRELPLQVKVKYTILQNKVDISADILVPGYVSRKMGQIPCEDVCVRMPLPECWIYMFRVEKHFRYGSVKASHRRQGKVKGIERILGAVDTLEQSLMEVSSGSAKYEHHHRAIAWRIPRLPKEGQGAYTNHTFSCKLNLTSFDQIPETFDRFCFVEYTMPHTTVSHTVCRSASISGGSGDPPEKYVRYLARYEYKVEMEFCYSKDEPAAYLSATQSNASKPAAEPPPPRPPSSDSDSDSD
ncbi:Protein stoned-B [Amphibalanus amphitrite]|uniref:Protein stoned-B n=1 Tax=Amphibalanus amphitrite TaxID=1232801 RepID=A0A6A4VTI5_AMPAM|nr:Protein stoned-B [Amphibalanus amphitrite]